MEKSQSELDIENINSESKEQPVSLLSFNGTADHEPSTESQSEVVTDESSKPQLDSTSNSFIDDTITHNTETGSQSKVAAESLPAVNSSKETVPTEQQFNISDESYSLGGATAKPDNVFTEAPRKSSRTLKQSQVGRESEQTQLNLSILASMRKQMKRNDTFIKSCSESNVSLDKLSSCLADLESKAQNITADYARLSFLSNNKVHDNVQTHFELFAAESENAKRFITSKIDFVKEINQRKEDEMLEEEDEEDVPQEDAALKEMESQLMERRRLLQQELQEFEEYPKTRKCIQKFQPPTISRAQPTTKKPTASQNEIVTPTITPRIPARRASIELTTRPVPAPRRSITVLQSYAPVSTSVNAVTYDNATVPNHSTSNAYQQMGENTISSVQKPTFHHSVLSIQEPKTADYYTLGTKTYNESIISDSGSSSKGEQQRTTTPPIANRTYNTNPSQVPNNSDSWTQLANAIKQSKKTDIEPDEFEGNPAEFLDWEMDFDTFLESRGIDTAAEKMRYLRKYTKGSGQECIGGQFLFRTEEAYQHARKKLRDRFGKRFDAARIMREKLDNWKKIQNGDTTAFQKYADYLDHCRCGMSSIEGLSVLNDAQINEKLTSKLPEWAKRKWATKVYLSKRDELMYPSFADFSNFVTEEAEMLAEPILSGPTPNFSTKHNNTRTLMTSAENQKSSCLFCSELHDTAHCRKLGDLTFDNKMNFIKENDLCYSCLRPGHSYSKCFQKEICRRCKRESHCTVLHKNKEDWDNQPAHIPKPQPTSAPKPAVRQSEEIAHSTDSRYYDNTAKTSN